MSRCEHGIAPVTDCYVCVSPKRGEDMSDYHELPEVPKCCGTCVHLDGVVETFRPAEVYCCHPANAETGHPEVAPHGLCSHWERRDDGG